MQEIKTLAGYFSWLESIGSKEHVMYPENKRLPDISAQALIMSMPSTRVRRYVETGTFRGFSAGLIHYFFPDAQIESIDPVLHHEALNISKQCPGSVTLLSSLGQLRYTPPIDLALIDGDHEYESAFWDRDWLFPLMAPGGVMAFDNLDHSCGCGKAFYEMSSDRIESKIEIGQIGFVRLKNI